MTIDELNNRVEKVIDDTADPLDLTGARIGELFDPGICEKHPGDHQGTVYDKSGGDHQFEMFATPA